MKTCPYCAEQIQSDAVKCRYCGEWLDKSRQAFVAAPITNAPFLSYYGWNFEYKSEAELFGLPLLHVARGIDPQTGMPRVARGIIAVGNIAIGGLALGGIAMGGITLGGMSFGIFSLGGISIGLLAAMGGMALGGVIAMGGLAVSFMYAIGGLALAPHYLGGNGMDPDFFRQFEQLFPGMRF